MYCTCHDNICHFGKLVDLKDINKFLDSCFDLIPDLSNFLELFFIRPLKFSWIWEAPIEGYTSRGKYRASLTIGLVANFNDNIVLPALL